VTRSDDVTDHGHGWSVDERNVGRSHNARVEAFDAARVDVTIESGCGCGDAYALIPASVLAAMLRQLGWTVTAPGGGT